MEVSGGLNLARFVRCYALMLLAGATVPCVASTTFIDGTFSLSNYTQTVFTSNTTAANATSSVTQNMVSGNPAPSLDFNVDWTVNTTFAIFDGLINSNFTYDPGSAGAISTINFSLDKNVTFTPGTVVFSNASGSALLEQGGKFYLDGITGPAFVAGAWQTVSATGLTASDFALYDFTTNTLDTTQHPDFSAGGGVIDFGFRTGLGHNNTLGTGFFDSLSDNLSFTIQPVPEPSSVWLALTLLLGVAVWNWARLRRKGNCGT